jgi:hypothetical protein
MPDTKGNLERYLQRFTLAVFVAQMAVSFHAQSANVLMPQPARDCRNIHACLIGNFLLEQFDDDFAFDRLALVDAQSAVILEKIRKLEFSHGQNVRIERAAN